MGEKYVCRHQQPFYETNILLNHIYEKCVKNLNTMGLYRLGYTQRVCNQRQ